MKTSGLFLVALFSFAPITVNAQWHGPNVPDSLSFQGFLSDTSGAAVPDANYNLLFRMYKGGDKIWEENHLNVPVQSGGFDVILSGTVSYPLDTVAFNEPIDLGITINGGSELTPRTPLASVAYALGVRGMYAIAADDGSWQSLNLIAGASNNYVGADVVGGTISGGGGWLNSSNLADSVLGDFGVVGGGYRNTAAHVSSTVGGGASNKSRGASSVIAGGSSNSASASHATIGGGGGNTARKQNSTIPGGSNNIAAGDASTVGGGQSNIASGSGSVVIGGSNNQATGPSSVVLGGVLNASRGANSVAAGWVARARHDGSFVWSDRSVVHPSDSVPSTGPNQFIIRAAGGVGLGTNAPANQLSVSGSADISGSLGIGTDSPTAHVTLSRASEAQDRQLELQTRGTISTGNYDGIRFTQLNGPSPATLGAIDLQFLSNGRTKMTFRIRNGDSLMTIRDGGVDVNGVLTETSDARLKTDVSLIQNALVAIEQLEGVSYRWKDPNRGQDRQLGFMAQDLESVVPEVVRIDETGTYSVAYGHLVPLLTQAIKEQQSIIDDLQSRLLAVEAKLIN